MAAYAAATSLLHTLEELLSSRLTLFANSSEQIIFFAAKQLGFLKEALKRSDGQRSSRRRRKQMEDLEGEMRDAVHKLEDVFEYHVYNQIISAPENECISFSMSEEERQEINSLVAELKKLEEVYIEESEKTSSPSGEDEEGEEEEDQRGDDRDGKKVNVVGLDDSEIEAIRTELMGWKRYELGLVSFVGMPGTGRTFLPKLAFEEKGIVRSFDKRGWVTVGPRYQLREIMIDLLSQTDPHHDHKLLSEQDDEQLGKQLHASLKGRRYLIVLDNVCDTNVWSYLRSSFPAQHYSSRIVLTTSLEEVAQSANSFSTDLLDVLSDERSWDLIRELLFFPVRECPPELEEAGKKIAHNCQGLRVEIVKIVFLLSQAEKTAESWNKIAAETQNLVSVDAYDEMSQISQIIEHLQLDNLLISRIIKDLHLVHWLHFSNDENGHVDDDDNDDYDEDDDDEKSLRYLLADPILYIFYQGTTLHNTRQGPVMVALLGMAGIGKTTLAKEIFEDQSTLLHFDHRVWLTLGPKYRKERIVVDILALIDLKLLSVVRAQIDLEDFENSMEGDFILAKHFCPILSNKRCLFVLDDVWDQEPLIYLEKFFKDIKFEVLLTTRLKKTAEYGGPEVHEMRLLNTEESWRLFCENVFGEKNCPARLEKPGRIIAEKCDGLPLMIVRVASLLFEVEQTPEVWIMVARKENLFEKAYDKISHILLPSYDYLRQRLKPFFLYMGVFPKKCETPTSKLLALWRSEGILEPNPMVILEEIVSNSLLLIQRNYENDIKNCRLQSAFWHMCIRKATSIKFFQVLNRRVDDFVEEIKGQRRLCIHNNVLLGIKDVYTSIASTSMIRSLLCTGSYHQYPVPVCFSFTLLRILDARTIRFYEFPIGVVELVMLRYLSLTCYGMLPPSISKLRNLQYLIVKRHLNIKLLDGGPMFLPMEIWTMKQLMHLEVMGGDLPDPCGAILPKLRTLLDVSTRSCTKVVLEGTPKLKKLGIRIELAPSASESLLCSDHGTFPSSLESFKCIVVNPELSFNVNPLVPVWSFHSRLTKLSLSGLGYPWEYMSIIGKLGNLEVLKLQGYAFRGPEWVVHIGDFYNLDYLLIEDTDLVYWRADKDFEFQSLSCVTVRHGYKLQEIPSQIASASLKIELIDCHPSASKQIQDSLQSDKACAHSSWE